MKSVIKLGSVLFVLVLFFASLFIGMSPQKNIKLNSAEAVLVCTNCKAVWETCPGGKKVIRCRADGDGCDVGSQTLCD